MLTKINHSSLFSLYLLIVGLILILTPCYSIEHFVTEQEFLMQKNQSQRITESIEIIKNQIKKKLPGQQSIKCLLALRSILNDKSIISIPDQEIDQKITIRKQKLEKLQFDNKQDSQSQCQIVTDKIEILLLQNNEINKVLIKSQNAQRLTQSQLSKCQQNLKDCQNKVIPNDCSKCTCPPSQNCQSCQKARQAAKLEGENTKKENQKLKGRIIQYQAEQKNWSQALGVILPKLKNQASYAISSQSIGNFNFNKISAILSQINSVADQSKNQNISQKSNKHRTLVKQLTEEFIYFINVTTKAYSKIVDERNSLLDLSKSITAQLKQCNKVLKNEK